MVVRVDDQADVTCSHPPQQSGLRLAPHTEDDRAQFHPRVHRIGDSLPTAPRVPLPIENRAPGDGPRHAGHVRHSILQG